MTWFMNISVYYSHKLHDCFLWFMKFDTFFFWTKGKITGISWNHPLVMGIIRSSLRSPHLYPVFPFFPQGLCVKAKKSDGLISRVLKSDRDPSRRSPPRGRCRCTFSLQVGLGDLEPNCNSRRTSQRL